MSSRFLIKKTEAFVKSTMKGDAGHDWSHVDRVRRNALYIAHREGADSLTVELGALLHDVADWKFHKDEKAGGKISRAFLEAQRLPAPLVDEVCFIVDHVSWKEGRGRRGMRTLEGRIVQDADRLEAIGAIGIARVFTYGGYRNRSLPSSVDHFYEKLLRLKDHMNTKTGLSIARARHRFMETYLREFHREWNGPDPV